MKRHEKEINMKRFILSCILIILFLVTGCGGNTITIKGEKFGILRHNSAMTGYIANYEGLVDGRAYSKKIKSPNTFVWLDPNVRFSNYSKLTMFDIEDWTKGRPFGKHTSQEASRALGMPFEENTSNASRAVSQVLATSSLTNYFENISNSAGEEIKEGLIIKGAVTRYETAQGKRGGGMTGTEQGQYIDAIMRKNIALAVSIDVQSQARASDYTYAQVASQILLVDASSGKVVGEIMASGYDDDGDLGVATENMASIIVILIDDYWNESPGFDPKKLIKEKTAGHSK
jgi:hypothetical protein